MKTQNEHKDILIDAFTQVKYYLNTNGLGDIVYNINLVTYDLFLDDFICEDEHLYIDQYIKNCTTINELIGINENILSRDTEKLLIWVDKQIEILSFS